MMSNYIKNCLIALFLFITPVLIWGQENFRVSELTFEGNDHISSNRLEKEISIYATSWFQKSILRKAPFLYNEDILQNDIRKIKRYYQKHGFLNIQIEEPQLKIDRNDETVALHLRIIEGKPILINRINYRIVSDSTLHKELEKIVQNNLASMSLSKGERFRDEVIRSDKHLFMKNLSNHGYPYAEVEHQLSVNQNEDSVNVTWLFKPGPKCYFGDISIEGIKDVSQDYIFRQLNFSPGDLFQRKILDESQRRLFSTGLFEVVTVKGILKSDQNIRIPVQIQVKESSRFSTRFGVGYGDEDSFRIFSNMRKLGFPKGAQRIELLLKHSGLEPYNLDLKWIEPVFFSHNTAFTVNPYLRKEKEPSYTVERFGGTVSVFHQILKDLKGSFSYYYESVEEDTTGFGIQESEILDQALYNKSGPIFGVNLDNSEPIFDPTRGMFVSLTLKVNGFIFPSDFPYSKVILDARRYSKFNIFVLASRLKVGQIIAHDSEGFIPAEERFYSGGSTSVRGWARQQLGPKNETGDPSGGKSLLEGSLEFRYPIYKNLAGAIFLDAGNVWTESFTHRLNELRYALGTGIGVNTPIGPVRIDVAIPIFDAEEDIQFHFNVGHAF